MEATMSCGAELMPKTMEKISCVIITRKREYPKLVLERLDLGFFDEIIIKTECQNIYQRYREAQKARNNIIYFQDDDCLVNYQVLFKKFNGQLTNTMTKEFKAAYDLLGITLVGWGCYITKPMLEVFDRYISAWGYDEHLYREADRIFTYFNKPFNTIIMPHEDLFQNEERMSTTADGKVIQSHFDSRNEAIRKCSLV